MVGAIRGAEQQSDSNTGKVCFAQRTLVNWRARRRVDCKWTASTRVNLANARLSVSGGMSNRSLEP